MNLFIFSSLLVITIVFYMLEISFKSFSRIALAGFLNETENKKTESFDYVGKHELVLNALRGFTFFLQLGLFISAFILLKPVIEGPAERVVLLLFSFLFLFNFFLYTVAFSTKEVILKKLMVLTPVAWFFFYPVNMVFARFVQKIPDIKENDTDDLSEKELEVFFEEGTKEGVLETEDKEMIESIIEFGDTLVKAIITPRVDMIYVDMGIGLDDLITFINETKKSRYPVIVDRIDNIEGIILAKDVFNYWKSNGAHFDIKKILRNAFFIPETMRILELLKELQKSKQKFAIVSDEFGGVTGLVTMEDIIEEIVGEIHDEYDEDTEQIIKEKDYFIVKGDTEIYELSSTLAIKLDEDEDYQTVAGLMSFKLGKIPDMADTITVENYTFEVIDMEKNRVKKVKIKGINEG